MIIQHLILRLKKEVRTIVVSIQDVENVMLTAFKQEPFHSFNFLSWLKVKDPIVGGSCSDKVMSIFNQLEKIGCDVYLHEAYINNNKCHRVLRVLLNGRTYFADVGNAWPIIKLIPADAAIRFLACGIQYHTVITETKVDIFHLLPNENQASLVVSIGLAAQGQQSIIHNIRSRLERRRLLPFNNKIRFAQIIGNDFLFMKDDSLRIYFGETTDRKCRMKEISMQNANSNELISNINRYFNVQQISIENDK